MTNNIFLKGDIESSLHNSYTPYLVTVPPSPNDNLLLYWKEIFIVTNYSLEMEEGVWWLWGLHWIANMDKN